MGECCNNKEDISLSCHCGANDSLDVYKRQRLYIKARTDIVIHAFITFLGRFAP